jgi:hypothetical protein
VVSNQVVNSRQSLHLLHKPHPTLHTAQPGSLLCAELHGFAMAAPVQHFNDPTQSMVGSVKLLLKRLQVAHSGCCTSCKAVWRHANSMTTVYCVWMSMHMHVRLWIRTKTTGSKQNGSDIDAKFPSTHFCSFSDYVLLKTEGAEGRCASHDCCMRFCPHLSMIRRWDMQRCSSTTSVKTRNSWSAPCRNNESMILLTLWQSLAI